jgi:hypothetical protein
MRHDRLGKALGIETTEKWDTNTHTHTHTHTHTPKPVCEHEDVTGLYNQELHTDREVLANRPDIIIKNRKEKTSILINMAIPADRNVVRKELKYKSLEY